MPIIWTKRAETDLWLLIGFINKDSPENAKKVFNKIQSVIISIREFPLKHPKEPFYDKESVRFTVIYNYKIVFQVQKDSIRILRIFHTKQNPKKI